jgi:hypothetical protein
MKFLNGIFSRVSGNKTLVFSDLSFCLVFNPRCSVLQNAIHEQTRVFLFCGFFCKNFKTREE